MRISNPPHLFALCALVASSAVFVSSRAHATPGFPSVIRGELGLEENPHCALCHIGTPGQGTARTPFAKYMVSRGLEPRNDDSLRLALKASEGERRDSDRDGVTDIEALKQGLDPNGDQPEYGCVGRIGGGAEAGGESLFALPLLALGLHALRKRKKPRARRLLEARPLS